MIPVRALLVLLLAVQAPAPFAARIASLSEPAGYFDTDNLISNERSFQQVLQELGRRKVRGGAYVGVGPDQNFTYIADIRPSIAFIIDVRRDNMLLHLLFKALFALSRTRIEFLAQLTGRPRTGRYRRVARRTRRSPDRVYRSLRGESGRRPRARRVACTPRSAAPACRCRRKTAPPSIASTAASSADGLALMFESHGRAPQGYNPTYRDLLREVDESGRQAGYLASEDAFQFVKGLQARDLVIPVVGDLSGPSAVKAIGAAIAARNERLSADLRVQRRVLPVPQRHVRPLGGQSRAPSACADQRRDPIDLRPLWRGGPARRRQRLAGPERGRAAAETTRPAGSGPYGDIAR